MLVLFCNALAYIKGEGCCGCDPVLDLPIGSIGWSLGPPAKVYNIFYIVIELSHLCCHKVLYFKFLNNPSVIFFSYTPFQNIAEF